MIPQRYIWIIPTFKSLAVIKSIYLMPNYADTIENPSLWPMFWNININYIVNIMYENWISALGDTLYSVARQQRSAPVCKTSDCDL